MAVKWAVVAPGLLGVATVFLVGYALGSRTEADTPETAEAASPAVAAISPAANLPAAVRETRFPPMSEYDTDGGPLDDAKFDALLETLGERLDAEETRMDFEREAPVHLWSFVRRLASPALSEEQVEKAQAFLGELADRHAEHRALFEQRRSLVSSYAEAQEHPAPLSVIGSWFPDMKEIDTGGELFTDEVVDQLVAVLDALLGLPETLAEFDAEAGTHLWRFANRLGLGRLTETQTVRIVSFLEGVKEGHPEAAERIDQTIFQVRHLMPGQVAPNIVGKDAEGVEFALEDYRGDIVALYFTGQWCGPCRGEYPYQRFMLELYEDDPVTILGVNSDEDIQTLRDAKEEEGLAYRSWWDGHGENNTEGPIASAWNVTGWPTIYVLDEEGVIRTANKRRAEVVTVVNGLLGERRMREREAQGA